MKQYLLRELEIKALAQSVHTSVLWNSDFSLKRFPVSKWTKEFLSLRLTTHICNREEGVLQICMLRHYRGYGTAVPINDTRQPLVRAKRAKNPHIEENLCT